MNEPEIAIENTKVIQSPCKNACELDAAQENCISCARTLVEIENWSKYSDDQRAKIMNTLPEKLKLIQMQLKDLEF